MKLKDSELKSILAEVETEIASLLKTEAAALKKAKEDEEAEETSAPEASAEGSAPMAEASAPPDEGSAPEASAPEAPAPEASDPAAEASAPAPEEAPAPEASAADPAAEAGPVDPEALKAEYVKLPPESLKAHYMAAKAALFELMGAGGGAAAPAPAPEASAPVAPPAPAPEEAPVPAMKSEQELKVADLEKQVELMAKALDIALGTPMRKAVTSVAHVPRTEEAAAVREPTKAELKEQIRSALGSGKLTKSQKDQLFSYTLGNIDFSQVKDLLNVK
jgi:hypothetical protein